MATKDKLEFVHAMAKHSAATLWDCRRLLRYAATHQRLATEECNRQFTPMDEQKRIRVRQRIRKIAESFGAQARFSGDPRGCTVKLAVPDGYTNDWGKEGICVPTI
jgi:hypothetical protein